MRNLLRPMDMTPLHDITDCNRRDLSGQQSVAVKPEGVRSPLILHLDRTLYRTSSVSTCLSRTTLGPNGADPEP